MIRRVLTGPLDVNCYIVGCPITSKAIVIDPGGHPERILEALKEMSLTAELVVDSHGHFDHIGGNAGLVERTGTELLIHGEDLPFLREAGVHADFWGMEFTESPEPDRLLKGGEKLGVGELVLEVIHTPGHSPGGISLFIPGHVFTGDALFEGSIGRTDLPGGDYGTLLNSIRERLLTLPDDTVVHPGHGPESTIGREKRENPFLR